MYNNSQDIARWFKDGGDTRRYQYNLNADSIVVDLGGYEGKFADTIFKKFGCKVYVYEPIKSFFDQCTRTNKNNPGVTLFPIGVSGYTAGEVEISVEGDASSIYKANGNIRKEKIQLVPVSCLFDGTAMLTLNKITLKVQSLISLKHFFFITILIKLVIYKYSSIISYQMQKTAERY